MDWTHDGYTLTDDPRRADAGAIHALLRDTYWAGTRPREAGAGADGRRTPRPSTARSGSRPIRTNA